MEEKILEALREYGRPLDAAALKEIIKGNIEEMDAAVITLLEKGKVLLTKKRKLALAEQSDCIFGKIIGHARGFAFFRHGDDPQDIFIPAESMHGAMHNDMVWVRASGQVSRNGSPEGEVVSIAKRGFTRVVGSFVQQSALGGYVVPDDSHMSMDILITPGEMEPKQGDKVVAKIIEYPDGRRPLLGTIVEILGKKGDANTQVLSIIRQYGLDENFSKNAMRQAKRIAQNIPEDEYFKREILKDKTIITIDGADSRDLDDAISLDRLANGNYYLGVHIADVSAYVKENTALDIDALARGTSVYFPDRVIPMLPEELSNGICSLNEGVDRLALSCFMEIDKTGKVVSHRLAETIICSSYRLVYEDVSALLEGDEVQRERYDAIIPMLTNLEALFRLLSEKRSKRGSLDFDFGEAKILLNEKGHTEDIVIRERGISNRIIEECMLLANETVAQHMAFLNIPFMYRVHETPDREKITSLNAFLQSLNISVRNTRDITPRALQKILLSVKGTPEESAVSKVMLRAMQRAKYSDSCLGHFGIAAKYYCHFTSPIRRYPDLIGHRIIKELIHGKLDEKRLSKISATLPGVAEQCSVLERTATEAERSVDDLKKCEYMKDRIGESCAGVIAGVTSFGFFVELSNTVEGLVHINALRDDYYIFDEKTHRLIGRSHGRVFRLGEQLEVRVNSVDMESRRINFELTDLPPKREKPASRAKFSAVETKSAPPDAAKTSRPRRRRKKKSPSNKPHQ